MDMIHQIARDVGRLLTLTFERIPPPVVPPLVLHLTAAGLASTADPTPMFSPPRQDSSFSEPSPGPFINPAPTCPAYEPWPLWRTAQGMPHQIEAPSISPTVLYVKINLIWKSSNSRTSGNGSCLHVALA